MKPPRTWLESLGARLRGAPALPHAMQPVPLDEGAAHADALGVIALVAGGSIAISAAREPSSLRVWSTVSGRCLRAIDGATGEGRLRALLPTTDGRVCATVSDETPWALRVWDLTTGACRDTVHGKPAERFSQAVLDPRNERAIVLSYAQPLPDPDCKEWRVTVVDLRAPGTARDFDAMEETYAVGSVRVHPDGRRAFIGLEGVIEVWDLDTGAQVGTLRGCGWSPEVVLDPSGERCIAGAREGHVRVWETASSQRVQELDVGSRYASPRLLPDGDRAVVTGHSGPPQVWDLALGTKLHAIGTTALTRDRLAFASDATLMVALKEKAELEVWDVVSGALLAKTRLRAPTGAFAVERDPNGIVRVVVGEGRGVRILELVAP